MSGTNGTIVSEQPSDKQREELTEMCPETKVLLWDGEEFDEFEPEYLNQVYPEKLNRWTVAEGVEFVFHYLSCSLWYWVELVEKKPPQPGKLSRKDMAYLKDELTSSEEKTVRRWSTYFNDPAKFREEAKLQDKFVPAGKKLHEYKRGDQQFEVYYSHGNDADFVPYKERFEILLLLFVDGASFTEDEPDWHYYIVYRRDQSKMHFVGLLSKYEFRITYNKQRDRISQVLVLPPYQKQGHGKELLDLVYDESLKNLDVFEITVEGPSFEFQCLRDYKEAEMLLKNSLLACPQLKLPAEPDELAKLKDKLLNSEAIRSIKLKLKLPGHQIERIANILVYASILKTEDGMLRASFEDELRKKLVFDRSAFKTRRKRPYLHVQGEEVDIKDMLLERSKEELLRNRHEIEQILAENLDGFRRVILRLSKLGLL